MTGFVDTQSLTTLFLFILMISLFKGFYFSPNVWTELFGLLI